MNVSATASPQPDMRFCSDCGGRIEKRIPASDHLPRNICSRCGRVHYENPKLLASCTLHTRDSVLFIRRGLEPYKGQWQLPGGFVECGESPEEAAAREAWEELRIKLDPARLTLSGVCTVRHMNQLYLNFRCELQDEQWSLTDEAIEIKLFREGDIEQHSICYPPALLDHLHQFYKGLREGTFVINDYVVDHELTSVKTLRLKAPEND